MRLFDWVWVFGGTLMGFLVGSHMTALSIRGNFADFSLPTGLCMQADAKSEQISDTLQWIMHETGSSVDLDAIEQIIVIPGGGPGGKEAQGFPIWTQKVCDEALSRYFNLTTQHKMILALSAGSMNAPSARAADGTAVFESTAITAYLVSKGVPASRIFADFTSWDTVGNAWAARSVVESLLRLSRKDLVVQVFISDFHARRMQAIFEWVFGKYTAC
jgi:uncharacterized SAM-binding protein YcdF (DUF218 family)